MDEAHVRLAEALVFASAEPVPAHALQQLLPAEVDAAAVLTALQDRCSGRAVTLVEVAGGWQFRTAPDLAPALRRVVQFGLRDLRDLPKREDLLVEPPPVVPVPLEQAPPPALPAAEDTLDTHDFPPQM